MNADPRATMVMADYGCFPLWREGSGGTVNVDPGTLPISRSLVDDLLRWEDAYDGTLNRNDPASSGFPSAEAEDEFYRQGAHLAERLARELGPEHAVPYFDARWGPPSR